VSQLACWFGSVACAWDHLFFLHPSATLLYHPSRSHLEAYIAGRNHPVEVGLSDIYNFLSILIIMMVNKGFIRPQRTFSPRSFMGDRGILIDSLGRVLRSDGIGAEEKIVAPKPWKACLSPVVPRPTWADDSLFSEAGQEIQGILLNSVAPSSPNSSSSASEDEDVLEMHIPVFSTSPCFISSTITPPTRSHNPMVQDLSFSHDNDGIPEGAELGLLSISPPSKGLYGTF